MVGNSEVPASRLGTELVAPRSRTKQRLIPVPQLLIEFYLEYDSRDLLLKRRQWRRRRGLRRCEQIAHRLAAPLHAQQLWHEGEDPLIDRHEVRGKRVGIERSIERQLRIEKH